MLDAQAASASAEAAGSVDAALIAAQAASAALATVKVHVDADAVLLTYALGLSDSTKSTYQLNVSTAQGAVNVSLQTLAASKAALELQETLNAADLASAKTALDSARSALTAAMFNVSSAAQAVAQAEADLALTVSGSRREVIAAQRARVAVEEASLAALFAELAKRRIVSPIDAIITLVNAKVGEIVQPGRTVVELQAQSDLEIIANISEIDVGRLEVGDPVVITLDAFPRTETWTGSVAAIDPAERIVDGVIFYRTTVALDGDDERLRSGMTANLEIETARAEDVLRVQLRAVRERDGKAFVDVLIGGVPIEREVVLGIENNIYAEVKSGLSEGETVIIAERER